MTLSDATAANPTFAAALGDAVLEFSLTVTDVDGAKATDSVTVTLTNVLPTANAGVDQTVASGATVTLDGSASKDLEGVVTYSWVQSSGSAVTLSDATAANPTFTAALGDAVLEFTLTVTDDDGATATDSVIVTLTNVLPTANAGVDQTVASGATVALDGSASKDLEGVVTFSWVQSSGSAVTLSDATAAKPTFTAALGDAVLEFTLTVTDVDGAKATDSVTVTLTNMLPTANAGVDQTVESGATVTLDGSASNDLEGAVSYSWVQSSGTAVTLSDATAANPTFTAALGDAVLEFSLTVTDVDGAKATDSVTVTLTNMLPTANAGVDQTVESGATVTLDGSASNDLEGTVSYSWVQSGGPAVKLSDATVVNPTFATALGDAVLEFTLTVTDVDGGTATDAVIVTLGHLISSVSFVDPNLQSCVSAIDAVFTSDVTALTCTNQSITDLSGLEELFLLEVIDLSNNNVQDLSPLASLTRLNNLTFDYNRVVDLSPLAGLFSLERLRFRFNRVVDISPIAGLTNLTVLDMNDNRVLELPELSVSLKDVRIGHNQLEQVDEIVNLTRLKILKVQANNITQLPDLSAHTSLEILDIHRNRSLLTLPNLPVSLKELDASLIGLSTLPDLSDLTALTSLNLNHNLLSTLPKLPFTLDYLSAGDNQLTDLDALAGHTQLQTLLLSDNHLTDDDAALGSALLTLTGLKELRINNNAIVNLVDLNNSISPSTLFTDDGRPLIDFLALNPSDVINLDTDPKLEVQIFNNASAAGLLSLTSPSGIEVSFAVDPSLGASYDFSPFADQGKWRVSDISFSTAGGLRELNDFAIGHFYSEFDRVVELIGEQTPDIDPPVLTSLTITPSSVDLANGPALVSIAANGSDVGSGITFKRAQLAGNTLSTTFSVSGPGNAIVVNYAVGFTDEPLRYTYTELRDVAGNFLFLGFEDLISAGFDPEINVTGSLDPALRNSASGQIYSQVKSEKAPGNHSYKFDVVKGGVIGFGVEWTSGSVPADGVLLIVSDNSGNELLESGRIVNIDRPKTGLNLDAGSYSVELSAVGVETSTLQLTFLGDLINIKRDSDSDGIADDVDIDDDSDGFSDLEEIEFGSNPLNPFDSPGSPPPSAS